MASPSVVHPVDEMLPLPRLVPLALQHVLVMYAGAVAVPLIIGRALRLSPEDVAFLISADLFACGLATLVQCVGFGGVGIRLPVMMGVTFASVGPMLAMAATPDVGLLGIYGAVIAAGVFGIVVAPFISRMLPLFPPVVTGTIILVIGISLMRVGINWAGGGLPTVTRVVDGARGAFPNPNYGQLGGLGIALFVLCVILALIKWGKGFLANVAVLLGIIAGSVLASMLGVSATASGFLADLGLRSRPGLVRFRPAPTLGLPAGVTELAVRSEDLAQLRLQPRAAVIVENEITYLSVDVPDDGIVFWGKGFDVDSVGRVPWLAEAGVIYWGDIDTHGFAILDRLRAWLPHTRSVLMDRETLLAHRDRWVTEDRPARSARTRLTADERELYAELVQGGLGDRVRLEQERVDWGWVERKLCQWPG